MEVNSYVECINDEFKNTGSLKLNLPKKNKIYTVRHVKEIKGMPRAITLHEISNNKLDTGEEPHFSLDKFKSVIFDKDMNEWLDEILEGTGVHQQADEDYT